MIQIATAEKKLSFSMVHISGMAKDFKSLLVWKDILFFTYCVISGNFTGPTQFLPVYFRIDSDIIR